MGSTIAIAHMDAPAFSSYADAGTRSSGDTLDETSQSTPMLTAAVTKNQKFNSAVLSLSEDGVNNAGLAFGDSCNVVFSNGYTRMMCRIITDTM